jgi:hypothetical protein
MRHVAIRTSILDRFPCPSRTNITRTHSSNSFLIFSFFPYFQVPSPPGHSFSLSFFVLCLFPLSIRMAVSARSTDVSPEKK